MSCLEALISADRIVIAGIAAYDKAMENAWATAASEFEAEGAPSDLIEAAKVAHDESTARGRGKLHRELWTRALALIASEESD